MSHPDRDNSFIKIEKYLSGVNNIPSDAYYSRMANAPWVRSSRQTRSRRLPVVAFGSVLVIMVIIFMARSPLSTFAESIASYFIDSGIPEITIHPDEIAVLGDPVHYKTLESLQNSISFSIHQPDYIPTGYLPVDFIFHPGLNIVYLVYENSPGEIIEIVQSPNSENYRRIFNLENMERILIDDKIGEYSIGVWREESLKDSAAETPVSTIQAVWDPTLEYQVLRWLDDEMIFEVRYYYLNGLNVPVMIEELIRIAKSIHQVNE